MMGYVRFALRTFGCNGQLLLPRYDRTLCVVGTRFQARACAHPLSTHRRGEVLFRVGKSNVIGSCCNNEKVTYVYYGVLNIAGSS